MVCVYNNRIIDNKFINNFLWELNYSNDVQLFTNDNISTGLSDQIASAFSIKCISIYMEPLSPILDNSKSVYSRELSDYKYLQQYLFLDKKV